MTMMTMMTMMMTNSRYYGRRIVASLVRTATAPTLPTATATATLPTSRPLATVAESATATDGWQRSKTMEVLFSVQDDEPVQNAVQMLATYDIGCLVTTSSNGAITGVVSERDIVKKVAVLDRSVQEVRVKEIMTTAPNLITATTDDSVRECLHKMTESDIRHLPILDETGTRAVGMLSIKDCVQALLEEQDMTIEMLQNLSVGKTGFFVVD